MVQLLHDHLKTAKKMWDLDDLDRDLFHVRWLYTKAPLVITSNLASSCTIEV